MRIFVLPPEQTSRKTTRGRQSCSSPTLLMNLSLGQLASPLFQHQMFIFSFFFVVTKKPDDTGGIAASIIVVLLLIATLIALLVYYLRTRQAAGAAPSSSSSQPSADTAGFSNEIYESEPAVS